ncbi:MAG: hypothetical protein HYZ29_03320 [Myxococcales bacterium]|nr:hypothetical protein [Myxococcales bacterium]
MVRRSAWLAALCLAACGGDPAAPSAPSAEGDGAPVGPALDPVLGRTLNAWIAKEWPALKTAREEKCDDGKWQGLPPESRTLVLSVRDARFEKKQLLPLDLTGPLTAPKLHALRDDLALSPPGQAPPSSVTDEIRSLDGRRFVGVFHVTEHFGADRVFRTDRGRWEWTPGTLVAWLAVHDAATGAALCQTQMVVKNDTRSAPLAPRLKSDTRQRLTRELGRDLKSEAARALRRITLLLEMPG